MAGASIPTFPNIGYTAPAPFPDLFGASRKVEIRGQDHERMDMTLRNLRVSGRPYGLSEGTYIVWSTSSTYSRAKYGHLTSPRFPGLSRWALTGRLCIVLKRLWLTLTYH